MGGRGRGRELEALLAQVLEMTAGATRALAMRFTVEGSPLARVSRFAARCAASTRCSTPSPPSGAEPPTCQTARTSSRFCSPPATSECLDATIHESLRVRPVLPLTTRHAAVPFALDRLTVPAGALLTPNIVAVNAGPTPIPTRRASRPERFLGRKPETYGLLTFGGGGRRCLGAAFAHMEMRVVLSTVLGAVRLRPIDRSDERVMRRGGLARARGGRPHGGWRTRVMALFQGECQSQP